MKHFTPFLSAALVALWLVPQNMFADDCTFIPDLFPGQESTRTATEVSATVHVGEWGPQSGYDNTHLINPLASSNEDVVKVYSDGGYNAAVYFAAVGTADVTYTETIERSSCTGVEQTIHYTVQKGTPTLYFAGQDGMPTTEYTAAWSQSGGGDAAGGGAAGGGADGGGEGGGSYVWTPSCVARFMTLYDTGRGYRFVNTTISATDISFHSSNPAVASINANGQTTVNGLGSTVITAHWNGNDNWEAADAQYTLNVKKAANIYFSPSLINDTIDNVRQMNVVCPAGVTINRWQSSNTTYATVDAEGNVTMLKTGTVYIDAYSNENEEYASAYCRCEIHIAKKRPQIHFEQSSIKLELNATPYVFPELIKPNDLTNYYSWRSTSPSVATVDNAGNITIVGTGYTQIQYLYDQGETQHDPKYLPDIARLNLTVTTSGLYVGGTYVMSSHPDIFGDGSVVYSEENGETNLTLTNLNYNAGGGTFIQTTKSMNLNIYVVGNCYITNAAKGIQCAGPLYIWCQNKKDSIHINATNTAIEVQAMKVIDCYLFATGGQYGIYTNTFAVWAGGYIFAQGNTEAIRSFNFQKGMADMGGIEVLTKGVTFVEGTPGGFYTDYPNKVKAKYVEIGKIPLPLPDDEVTDINFETDNPYDNLDVVFSESEDDQFNSTEKQIEINTITLTKDVNDAYSANVACSSEWLKLLPGVLVFDVPAGKGEAEIECDIAAGKQLIVYIEGRGQVTFTTTENGIKIAYNVAEQTHVIIYLQASEPSSAPKRVAQAKQDAVPGVAIKSIKITPESAATGIGLTTNDQQPTTNKLLRDGQLFIIRDGRIYNAQGLRVQ